MPGPDARFQTVNKKSSSRMVWRELLFYAAFWVSAGAAVSSGGCQTVS